ncbi:MAG: PHP domain-containing protein [Acholeplasmatales bacterium]|nr:MAG: PHP domain-containing protein [Acholeplasmatales bacterium]
MKRCQVMKTNYHTHHELCGHAVGRAEDYVKEAIRHGMTDLGFSDHAPSQAIEDVRVRMRYDELPEYIADVRAAQEKHREVITVHLGLECEYFDTNPSYYRELLSQVDYLILGQHYVHMRNPRHGLLSSFSLRQGEEVVRYARSIERALQTPFFSLVAHPDLYMCGYDRFDDAAEEAAHIICEAAKEAGIPLEFNANGMRRGQVKTSTGWRHPYPVAAFWEIAKATGCQVMLSSDCHEPSLLHDATISEAKAEMNRLGLSPITHLTFKR